MRVLKETAGRSSNIENKTTKMLSANNKKLIFYVCMMIPLLLQVCVFYVYVNISNISLAFSKYELVDGVGFVGKIVWFENFKTVLQTLFSQKNVSMFGVSFVMYLFVFLVATPVSIIFSFYVYKKYPLAEFYRVILFFPQIISTVIMSSLYSYVVGEIYMLITGADKSLLSFSNPTTTIVLTVVFYNLWMGFGANVLLASGAMSGINESIVESCRLEGCSAVQEFIYITLPSIFPTITTFIVIDLAQILSNQMNLYTFFAQGAPEGVRSIGYYLYVQTVHSAGFVDNGLYMTYPQISAMGVMITFVVLPLTFTVRRLLEKFGPRTD